MSSIYHIVTQALKSFVHSLFPPVMLGLSYKFPASFSPCIITYNFYPVFLAHFSLNELRLSCKKMDDSLQAFKENIGMCPFE